MNPLRKSNQAAFTLLELLITLSLLVTIMISVSYIIRMGFDTREAISQKAKITHRFDLALGMLSRDLGGAFIISSKDTNRNATQKRTLFKLTKGDSDTLAFTYIGHSALRENAKESDISYVVYEVKESKKEPGRKHLYRGETPRVPKDFNDEVPMSLIAEDIASIRFEPWQGDGFSKDKWDSSNAETGNLIPHLVRVSVQAWDQAPEDRLGKDVKPSIQYSTVVYLPMALDFNQLKAKSGEFSLTK